MPDIVGQKLQVQQQISMKNQKHQRRHPEERDERQLRVQERQPHWGFQKEIAVGDRADRDDEISDQRQKCEPKPARDVCSAFKRLARLPQILRLRLQRKALFLSQVFNRRSGFCHESHPLF